MQTLAVGGALVIPSTSVFVQTDEGSLEAAKSDTPQEYEVRTQPRLALLVKHLKDEGIFTDDLIIRTGLVGRNMMRTKPYTLVQIPRLDKEIAVCDQVGEITFVANTIRGPAVWEHLSKDQLKVRSDITTIRFTNEEDWWNGIASILMGEDRTQEQKKKVQLSVYARKKQPLDVDLIIMAAKAYQENDPDGKWPNENSGVVLYGPLKGEKWQTISNAIRERNRSLKQANLPEEVKGLTSLLEWQELTISNLSQSKTLTVEDIVVSAKAHQQNDPDEKWPSAHSGAVLYGPLKGDNWANINAAIWTRERRLEQAGLPEEVRGLPSLLEWQGLMTTLFSETKVLSIEDIIVSAQMHFDKTGNWPPKKSKEILFGPLKGDQWHNINYAIHTRGRGLDRANLPEDVKGLTTLLEWKGLTVSLISKTKHLSIEKILASAKAHQQNDPDEKWPSAHSGVVLYGPLKGDQWHNIHYAIRTRGRELDKAGLPEEVKGLGSFLEWSGVKNDAPKDSPDGIAPACGLD
ncbi:MAG: hypothetical protein H6857_02985 [Rhodospirillales bacterium]|nr:hypothetical protein [Rhodospirillales bacterium]